MLCPWFEGPDCDHLTLREYLKLYGVSRSQLKKKLPKQLHDRNLKTFVDKKGFVSLPVDLINQGMISPTYDGPEMKVIKFDHPKFFGLVKPSLVHCTSSDYDDHLNCLSFLRSYDYSAYFSQFPHFDREKGLLYRLDFETSGVLVFCKDWDLTQEIFKNRDKYIIEKIYYARVQGEFKYSGEIIHYLKACGPKGMTMEAFESLENEDGKNEELARAVLEVLDSSYDKDTETSTLQIKLKTGHRHQIRTQLASLDHPICGDDHYREFYSGRGSNDRACLDRIDLHAFRYSIQINEKEIITFEDSPDWLF